MQHFNPNDYICFSFIFHIVYKPRTTLKAQALVDFVAELTFSKLIDGPSNMNVLAKSTQIVPWILNDRSVNAHGSGTEII